MIEIVPAVLPRTEQEFSSAMERLTAAGVSRVHLDVCDGLFVPTRSINGYELAASRDWGVTWDVHLMVRQPESELEHWSGIHAAERFFVHVETTDNMEVMSARLRSDGRLLGGTINPESSLDRLEDAAPFIDAAMFMTVFPGEQGRPFIPEVLDRLRDFHGDHPTIPVAVDGGVTPATAPACAMAGAGILVSGSFVMTHTDVAEAIQELQRSIV